MSTLNGGEIHMETRPSELTMKLNGKDTLT